MCDSDYLFQSLKFLINKGIRVEVRSSDSPIKTIRANDKRGVEHLYIPSSMGVLLHGPCENGKLKTKALHGVSVIKFASLLENSSDIERVFKEGVF